MLTGNTRVDEIIQNNFGVEIEREIGRGKYGIVYSGVDNATGSDCAIKVISLPTPELEEKLRDSYGDDEEKIEDVVREMANRFENEIKSMQKIGRQTDNAIRMNNHILTQEGLYFDLIISMELAMPLKRFLAQEEFTVEKVIDIGYETAQGLKICHSEGIIHRDIKEDNLFIGSDNRIKIGDFGVANINSNHVSKKTEGVGTPHYMAPEIKKNEDYNKTVDIYSLGIVLYMLLNENKPPFYSEGVSEREAYSRRMSGEPLPPPKNAPEVLTDIVLKCCCYNPDERYRSAMDLIKDLEDAKDILSAAELDTVVPYPKRRLSDAQWWDRHFKEANTRSIYTEEIVSKRNILHDTVGYFMDIVQRLGNDSGDADVVRNVQSGRGIAERDLNDEEKKVRLMKRILILMICVIVMLGAAMILLYPKTATFYSNMSDGNKVYVQYLFFKERALTDIAASYLSSDGKYVYFSNPDEDHRLYRANIWSGKTELLCDADCEYDILIGNYIYFTDFDGGEKLYRIKKDGTDKQCLIEYACKNLKNKNGNLSFLLVDTGAEKELDVKSIK